MLTDDHDHSDDIEAEPTRDRSSSGSRRFARLVESPTARRLSPRRLLAALALATLAAWGISEAGGRLSRSVGRWVASRPEHQVPFSEIEMVPAPPPYVRSGVSGILDSVRVEAKYPETISTLETDLEALRVAFSRNPWIERAGPIRSSYRHLSIQVVYRIPMALVVFNTETEKDLAVVIDREGVEMPSAPSQFEWSEKKPRYRAAGDSHTLVEVRGLGVPISNRLGLVLKSSNPRIDDDKVPEAAKLAEFLAIRADSKTPKGRPFPDFPNIVYDPRTSGFFLLDSKQNWVFWKSAPDKELTEEAKSTEKWLMLGRFIDRYGSLELDRNDQDILRFTPTQAEVYRPSKSETGKNTKPSNHSRG